MSTFTGNPSTKNKIPPLEITLSLFGPDLQNTVIHYLQNKEGVVDFANAQGLVMF